MTEAILAIEAEAAAGPRDEAIELCPECGGQYSDLAGHRRFAHNVPEAAAGPRIPQHSPTCAGQDDNADCICGVAEAYALGLRDGAAGPREALGQAYSRGLHDALGQMTVAGPRDEGHRPVWVDDVPTGECECGKPYPHEAAAGPRDEGLRALQQVVDVLDQDRQTALNTRYVVLLDAVRAALAKASE